MTAFGNLLFGRTYHEETEEEYVLRPRNKDLEVVGALLKAIAIALAHGCIRFGQALVWSGKQFLFYSWRWANLKREFRLIVGIARTLLIAVMAIAIYRQYFEPKVQPIVISPVCAAQPVKNADEPPVFDSKHTVTNLIKQGGIK